MVKQLSNSEKETIIVFNETPEPAHIFTYNKNWQSHLEKKVGLEPEMVNSLGGKSYIIDKSRIKPPRAKLQLTPEQKKSRAGRLHKRHSKD